MTPCRPATNSAPSSTNSPAAERKVRISQSTEWTGFLEITTMKPATTAVMAKR